MFHTQAFFCVLPFIATSIQSPTTTTTGGRMQAEKHRSALPCKTCCSHPKIFGILRGRQPM